MRTLIILCIFTLSAVSLLGQRPPRVDAQVGKSGSGSIKAMEFEAQQGVAAYGWVSATHAEPLTVDSFRLSVIRDTSLIFSMKNIGAYFTPEMRQLLKELKAGDKVLIFDIYSTISKNKKILVSPLQYLIE